VADATASNFTVIFAFAHVPSAPPATTALHSTLDWLWRGALTYYQPAVRSDLSILDAYEALVGSLADTYVDARPIPGVPTGFEREKKTEENGKENGKRPRC
jgi:hypothetical protein